MHNDANVLVLGQDVDQNTAKQMLKVWFETPFEGGRHQIRLDQIQAIEAENFKNIH
jgi:ribose 5-phosphate isomerase B